MPPTFADHFFDQVLPTGLTPKTPRTPAPILIPTVETPKPVETNLIETVPQEKSGSTFYLSDTPQSRENVVFKVPQPVKKKMKGEIKVAPIVSATEFQQLLSLWPSSLIFQKMSQAGFAKERSKWASDNDYRWNSFAEFASGYIATLEDAKKLCDCGEIKNIIHSAGTQTTDGDFDPSRQFTAYRNITSSKCKKCSTHQFPHPRDLLSFEEISQMKPEISLFGEILKCFRRPKIPENSLTSAPLSHLIWYPANENQDTYFQSLQKVAELSFKCSLSGNPDLDENALELDEIHQSMSKKILPCVWPDCPLGRRIIQIVGTFLSSGSSRYPPLKWSKLLFSYDQDSKEIVDLDYYKITAEIVHDQLKNGLKYQITFSNAVVNPFGYHQSKSGDIPIPFLFPFMNQFPLLVGQEVCHFTMLMYIRYDFVGKSKFQVPSNQKSGGHKSSVAFQEGRKIKVEWIIHLCKIEKDGSYDPNKPVFEYETEEKQDFLFKVFAITGLPLHLLLGSDALGTNGWLKKERPPAANDILSISNILFCANISFPCKNNQGEDDVRILVVPLSCLLPPGNWSPTKYVLKNPDKSQQLLGENKPSKEIEEAALQYYMTKTTHKQTTTISKNLFKYPVSTIPPLSPSTQISTSLVPPTELLRAVVENTTDPKPRRRGRPKKISKEQQQSKQLGKRKTQEEDEPEQILPPPTNHKESETDSDSIFAPSADPYDNNNENQLVIDVYSNLTPTTLHILEQTPLFKQITTYF